LGVAQLRQLRREIGFLGSFFDGLEQVV